MNQQQHSQTPQDQHQNQVPDHRLNEALERIRQLELQNAQLRTTVDMTVRQQLGQQPQGQQPGSAFKPEVLQELKAVVESHLAPLRQQMQHQMGMFYDQIDETRYRLQYSGEKWAPFHDKAERLRQEQLARNNYITREQALQMVYFEETGKKATPTPQPQQQTPAPKAPVWSPYLQMMVDPDTGLPPTQAAQPAPQTQELDPNFDPAEGRQTPTPHQVPQWQQQAAPQQNTQQQPQGTMPSGFHPQQNNNHPHSNPFGVQRPNLPSQGLNPQTPAQRGGPAAPMQLDIDASDAELEAFANKYGDIPL